MADLTRIVGSQEVQLVDPAAASTAGVLSGGQVKVAATDSLGQVQYNFPAGYVRTSDEPTQLFFDPFDGAVDTSNRYNNAVNSSGGVVASTANGVFTVGSGTAAGGFSYIKSQVNFASSAPGWLGNSFIIKIETPVLLNAHRFWGLGTSPATPTTAAPLTDAYGFEIATDGKLYGVVYAGGVRTVIQDFSSATGNAKQPTDANYHRYYCYYRTDKIYFYIDNLDTPVGTGNFVTPQVETLPLTFSAVAGSPTAPTSNAQISCTAAAMWDTGKNAVGLADGVFGWRKATVDTQGSLKITGTIQKPSDLCVSVTGASGAAVTATLPAVGSSFHHITSIEIVKYGVAAITGTATPVVVTTTNLPGSLAFTFDTAHAIGTSIRTIYAPTTPLRSVSSGVASTIVCPVVTNVIWRINVIYYATTL